MHEHLFVYAVALAPSVAIETLCSPIGLLGEAIADVEAADIVNMIAAKIPTVFFVVIKNPLSSCVQQSVSGFVLARINIKQTHILRYAKSCRKKCVDLLFLGHIQVWNSFHFIKPMLLLRRRL